MNLPLLGLAFFRGKLFLLGMVWFEWPPNRLVLDCQSVFLVEMTYKPRRENQDFRVVELVWRSDIHTKFIPAVAKVISWNNSTISKHIAFGILFGLGTWLESLTRSFPMACWNLSSADKPSFSKHWDGFCRLDFAPQVKGGNFSITRFAKGSTFSKTFGSNYFV